MITFIHPFSLIWLLGIIPLILFYIWKVRTYRREVVTDVLWQKALPILHPRRLWQPWRWSVSLAVQISILIVLVLALAEPCWRRPQRVVVVLDATSSMTVMNHGKSRYDRALEKMNDLVLNLGYNDRMALVAVGHSPHVMCRMTNNAQILLDSLKNAPQPGGTASVEEALIMARSLVTANSAGHFKPESHHVVLVSDGCFPHAKDILSEKGMPDLPVKWVAVGTSAGNVEVAHFSAIRRDEKIIKAYSLSAIIRNYGDHDIKGKLELEKIHSGDAPHSVSLNVQSVTVPAGDVGFTWKYEGSGADAELFKLTFTPSSPDDDFLPDDNTAETSLAEARSYKIAVVTPGNRYLENAVHQIPWISEVHVVADANEALALQKKVDAIIYDRVGVPEKETRPFLAFSPVGTFPYWKRSDVLKDYTLAPWMDGLPYGVNTAGVSFTQCASYHILPEKGTQAHAWLESTGNDSENVTLAWGLETQLNRCVLCSCDLGKSDWSMQDDFSRFLDYALDWSIKKNTGLERIHAERRALLDSAFMPRDANLIIPEAPTETFALRGEDVVPFWMILTVGIITGLVTEWCFFQRRWLE